LEVLNDLGGLIDGNDVSIVLGVLLFPGSVLLDTEGRFSGEGLNVLVKVLGGLADLLLSLVEGLSGIVTEFGHGNDLSFVVVDRALHIVDELFTGSSIVLVDLVSVGLLLVELSGDVLEEEVDLVDTVTSGSSKLHQ